MISKSTIESAADLPIEDVINTYYKNNLKRAGSVYKACCPFHDEKTASFVVSPAKAIYKCFGCGKSGNNIKFVMEYTGFSYPESIRDLCERFNITVEEDKPSKEVVALNKKKDDIYKVNAAAMTFFKSKLPGSMSETHLLERGISSEMIELFDLGHSTSLPSDLFKSLSAEFKTLQIIDAGLCKVEDQKSLDVFKGRLIFPTHNIYGKVVAFGGRRLNEEINPKYINTKETIVFTKGKTLYGLYQAKQEISKVNSVNLVEGYTDVIMLHQHGIKNTVASSGTSITTEQAKLIRRFTNNVVLLLDGDKAGLKAILRAFEIFIPLGMSVHAVPFKSDQDPDTMVRKIGGEKFAEYCNSRKKYWIEVMFSILTSAGKDRNKISAATTEIKNLINKNPDGVTRAVETQTLAKISGVPENTLNELKRVVPNKTQITDIMLSGEKRALRLLLIHPTQMIEQNNGFDMVMNGFKTAYETYKLTYEDPEAEMVFKYIDENKISKVHQLINCEDENVSRIVNEIIASDEESQIDVNIQAQVEGFTMYRYLFKRIELNLINQIREEESGENQEVKIVEFQKSLKNTRAFQKKIEDNLSKLYSGN